MPNKIYLLEILGHISWNIMSVAYEGWTGGRGGGGGGGGVVGASRHNRPSCAFSR